MKTAKRFRALVDVLKSDEIKDFINEKYDGAVIPFEESSDAEEDQMQMMQTAKTQTMQMTPQKKMQIQLTAAEDAEYSRR